MGIPTEVATHTQWNQAREALLAKEKELTKARDALAAERRRLPMVPVEKSYAFEAHEGEKSLLDLFEGRRQLIVYRFFLDPDMEIAEYPKNGCPGCTYFADNLPKQMLHLNARETTMVFVSGGEQEVLETYRKRMGWEIDWYTTHDDFSKDFDVDQWFGINVFFRDGDQIYRSYYTTSRGAEDLTGIGGILDITPWGRQEAFQDAPAGVPQDRTGSWMHRRDEYSPEDLAGGRSDEG